MRRTLTREHDPTVCTKTMTTGVGTYQCTDFPHHSGDHRWWLIMPAVVDDECVEPDVDGWHRPADPDRVCVHDETAWADTCASRIRVRSHTMGLDQEQGGALLMASPELQAAQDRFAAWVRDVRDPAEQATVEPVGLRHGPYRAEYQVAPIPTGWAWRASTDHRAGGSGTPWTAAATRDDALDAIRRHIARLVRDHPDAAPLLDDFTASSEMTLF